MSKPPVTQSPGRKQEVQKMFNTIAGSYDTLNHLLSFGIDKGWRRKLVKTMGKHNPRIILDLATGTADLAIAASVLKPEKIIGTDIAEEMLEIGTKKISERTLDQMIELQKADSENLPFNNDFFDAAMVAFGVRNYENLQKGISEMCRVIKPGGYAYVLEFSKPQTFPMKQLYHFYSYYILPFIGRLVSKHGSAYTYLPESVAAFPRDEEFVQVLKKAGFAEAHFLSLSFGITNLYVARK